MTDQDPQPPRSIDPGDPELENVLFVVLGVGLTLAALYRLTLLV